jgi:hypothetical protein
MKIEDLVIGRKYLIDFNEKNHPEYKQKPSLYYTGEGILRFINPEEYESGTLHFYLPNTGENGYFDIEDVVEEILPANNLNNPEAGFSANRLRPDANNPREVAFVDAWNKENLPNHQGFSLLNHLIPNCTDRDRKVAVTMIQWLGSGVGTSFLCDVINESPELRQFIMARCGVKLTRD